MSVIRQVILIWPYSYTHVLSSLYHHFPTVLLRNDKTVAKSYKRGEEITLENIQFKVTSADSRRLIQVRVTVPDEHLSDMEGVEEQAE